MLRTTLSVITLVGLALLPGNALGEAAFSFTKIADTSMPIPGGVGSFINLGHPAIDNGVVVFKGNGAGGQIGIFKHDGTFSVVVDSNTSIPGGIGSFTGFDEPTVDNGIVAYRGVGDLGQQGIYTDIGGMSVVAQQGTPIPGGVGGFTSLLRPSIDNGEVAFVGTGSSAQQGIYTDVGGLSLVADTDTPVPSGPGNLTDFRSPPWINGGEVVFSASASAAGHRGIYSTIGGLHMIADVDTFIPGFGQIIQFIGPKLDDGHVAFSGIGQCGLIGIITNTNGLAAVVDQDTKIPDKNETFDQLGAPSFDDGKVAFLGIDLADRRGVYTNLTGTLRKVVDEDDMLDGKDIKKVSFTSDNNGLSGNEIVFIAIFEDESQAVFVATPIPEPSTATLAAYALLGLLGRRSRPGHALRQLRR